MMINIGRKEKGPRGGGGRQKYTGMLRHWNQPQSNRYKNAQMTSGITVLNFSGKDGGYQRRPTKVSKGIMEVRERERRMGRDRQRKSNVRGDRGRDVKELSLAEKKQIHLQDARMGEKRENW